MFDGVFVISNVLKQQLFLIQQEKAAAAEDAADAEAAAAAAGADEAEASWFPSAAVEDFMQNLFLDF